MVLQQIQPTAALKPYVKQWLVLENTDPASTMHSVSFFADGCPGIVYQQSAAGGVVMANKADKLAPVFLYGQPVKPVQIKTEGQVRIIISLLQPHAIGLLFGVKADTLTDTCLDLGTLSTPFNPSLPDQLRSNEAVTDQIGCLSTYLFRLARCRATSIDKALDYALNHLLRSNGRVILSSLRRELNISERTFERRFEQYVGLSPRLFSRICRFQAALNQLESRRYQKLSDVAFDNGYADQSHFIRSFKEFTGLAPLDFQQRQS